MVSRVYRSHFSKQTTTECVPYQAANYDSNGEYVNYVRYPHTESEFSTELLVFEPTR